MAMSKSANFSITAGFFVFSGTLSKQAISTITISLGILTLLVPLCLDFGDGPGGQEFLGDFLEENG